MCDNIKGVLKLQIKAPSPPSHHGGGGVLFLVDQADELEIITNYGIFLIPGTMEEACLKKMSRD